MKRRLFALVAVGAVTAGIVVVASRPVQVIANAAQRAATGTLRAAHIDSGKGLRALPVLSAGLVNSAATGSPSSSAAQIAQPNSAAATTPSTGGLGCGRRNAAPSSLRNVRVNQDCTYRLQAEEGIAVNPANPSNLVAGMNDERQGYNLGGFAYSLDGGRTWGDGQPPFYQKINDPSSETPAAGDPNRHTITSQPGNGFTYDGGSDPIQAFDLEGRAFFGLVLFDRFLGNGSAVAVTQSPVGANGSFYYTPDTFSRSFIVVEDNDFTVGHDKPFIAVDVTPSSRNRDNVYVTWTVFRFTSNGAYTESPIYGSMSTDHALTWSTPEQISGRSPSLCFFGNVFDPSLPEHSCDFDQGADPITLPNGDLEVIFNNGNTPAGNPNSQQLGVHCSPHGSSPAGTAHLDCDAPSKVGDDITSGGPQCDFGRGPEQCIPGSFVRTDDFPRIATNRGNGDLYATWQDFRSGQYDIQLSRSTDGGKTWTVASAPVNPERGVDHYEAAIAVVCRGKLAEDNPVCATNGDAGNGPSNLDGSTLCAGGTSAETSSADLKGASDVVAISYYRTCQIPSETTACPIFSASVCRPSTPGVQDENSDYTLVGGSGLSTPFGGHPVSPTFAPPRGGRDAGFMGDYSGIALVGTTAHPIWADPRNTVPLAFREPEHDQRALNDEDIFTVATAVPGT